MNLSSIYQIFHGNLLAQKQTLVALRTQALLYGAPARGSFSISAQSGMPEGVWVLGWLHGSLAGAPFCSAAI